MGNYPHEGIDIKDDKIILTKDFIEHQLDLCEFASKRSKETKDEESFTYFKGRAGVFLSLLENWKYKKEEE